MVVHGNAKKGALLTFSVEYGETTYAIRGACVDRADDVRRGGDIEHRAAVSYGYRHVRVAWNYYLHVNQQDTLTVSPRQAYLYIARGFLRTGPNWGYFYKY